MNLIDRIEQEMLTDDDNRENQSIRLTEEYNNAPDDTKKALDYAFICLCGYSLKTLLTTK